MGTKHWVETVNAKKQKGQANVPHAKLLVNKPYRILYED